MKLCEKAYGKLNLTLDVLCRREDGYHDLKSVMQTVSLYDLVAWLFGGQGSLFSRLVYTLVGLAGIWCATFLFRRHALVEGE